MSLGGGRRLDGMQLYYHPRSPYSHKVLIALAEKSAEFVPVMIRPDDPQFAKLTPIRKVPVLVLDNGWKIPESTIIVEYLDTHVATGTQLIPDDRDLARQTRFHDRIADLYITEPVLSLVFKRPDPEAAHTRIDAMLTGLDEHLAKRTWIMGDAFTMADCSLIPTLRYSREVHPFERYRNVTAYFGRALERPSVKRVFDDVAPHLAMSA